MSPSPETPTDTAPQGETRAQSPENAIRGPSGGNFGHGWVHPRPDGAKARCGGPGICPACSQEAAAQDRRHASAGGQPDQRNDPGDLYTLQIERWLGRHDIETQVRLTARPVLAAAGCGARQFGFAAKATDAGEISRALLIAGLVDRARRLRAG